VSVVVTFDIVLVVQYKSAKQMNVTFNSKQKTKIDVDSAHR